MECQKCDNLVCAKCYDECDGESLKGFIKECEKCEDFLCRECLPCDCMDNHIPTLNVDEAIADINDSSNNEFFEID